MTPPVEAEEGRTPPAAQGLLSRLRSAFAVLDDIQRHRAVELTRFELRELENCFVLLLLGSFVGIPAPPAFIALELLPCLEHELAVLNSRAENSSDALAELAGLLEVT